MMTPNHDCRFCDTPLKLFLDLGEQPPANRNITRDEWLTNPEPTYPLRVGFCPTCNLAQLMEVVSKEELYRVYQYVSSPISSISQHFAEYAAEMQERFLKPGDLVVEIGGNDGVMLVSLKGVRTLNVEPAENIAPMARARGVETICDFWTAEVARKILATHGKAKLICGSNAIAHIANQQDVAQGVKELLADDGVWVIQAPYLGDMFDTLGYGQIYHEHLSFFAFRPLKHFYEKFGLEPFDVKFVPSQGLSMRIYLCKKGTREASQAVRDLEAEEARRGFHDFQTYVSLADEVRSSKEKLVEIIRRLKDQGKRIAAYGAAAKGMTIVNYARLTNQDLDFCVDDLKEKHGRYTPGSHVPIISSLEARTRPPDYYLLLAWNFKQGIVEKEKEFVSRGGKFIMPIGEIEVF